MVSSEGTLTLWRGLGLTLWRDVPFSAIYWFGYEVIKARLRERREDQWLQMYRHPEGILPPSTASHLDEQGIFMDSFIAGALSGSFAAFVTSPYDVGKTRRQIAHVQGGTVGSQSMTMPRVLFEIWKEGGLAGMWKGCIPRMLKVAPACAIMVWFSSLLRVFTLLTLTADIQL